MRVQQAAGNYLISEQLIDTVRGDVSNRLEKARSDGKDADTLRLEAMIRVLDSRYIPLACPDAVFVAGDAAEAAYKGRSEAAWRLDFERGPVGDRPDPENLDMAVRLLKAADMWPWQV